LSALNPAPAPPVGLPVQTGMSTTTMIALAGGALLLVAVLAKR
jgi:LPXTG-motif cell wall-anchored protein